jgi:16S rRNA (guanine966-N2)-methyltransferase
MALQITGGYLKGRRLAAVKGRVRPTAAKVREAIFNILGPAVEGARVLDLFAGTGALGLEALSRGAREAVFVEEQAAALTVLRRNLEALDLQARTRIKPLSVPGALRKLAAGGEKFDLAFLDPPYERGLAAATLEALEVSGILHPAAWVVAEHSRRETLPEVINRLHLQKVRRYGDTQIAFYLSRENEEEQEIYG